MVSIKKGMQGFGRWLFNIKEKRETYTPIDPEQIKKDETIKALYLKLQSRDAELARKLADEREEIEEDKKRDLEDELKLKLNEQKAELRDQKFKNVFSFLKFYQKLFKDSKFRNQLEIVDRDDETVFAKFGDFRIVDGGKIALVDAQDNLICMGKQLSHIVYKPDSLSNQIKRKKISIPFDKNFVRIPDVEEILVPNVTKNADGEYQHTVESQQPFIEAIKEREELIDEKAEEVERLESIVISLNRKLSDLQRTNRIYESQSQVNQSELSKAADISLQHIAKMGDIHRRMVTLQEYQVLHETMIHGLQQVNTTLLSQQEEMGTKTEFRKALMLVQEMLRNAKDLAPRVVHEHIQPEPQKTLPIQPGEVLK